MGGPAGGTGNGTARTQRTRGSWCWCPDAASGSSHQRSWPPLIAASWWFLPLLPAHNPPQPRNGLPIHHCGSKTERRGGCNVTIAGGTVKVMKKIWVRLKHCHHLEWEARLDSDDTDISFILDCGTWSLALKAIHKSAIIDTVVISFHTMWAKQIDSLFHSWFSVFSYGDGAIEVFSKSTNKKHQIFNLNWL